MRNIALFLTYLGTDYHGWQVQKNLPTVAETVEKAAQLYMLTEGFERKNEIKDEELKALAKVFGLNYKTEYLD